MTDAQSLEQNDTPQSLQKRALEHTSSATNVSELRQEQPTEVAADAIEQVTQEVRKTTNRQRRKELLKQRRQLEKDLENSVPNPPLHPNWVSQIFFYWVTPLIRLGRKKQLELSDLFGLPIRHRAAFISKEFYEVYTEKQEEGKKVKTLLFNTFKALYGRTWAIAVVLYIFSQLFSIGNPLLLLGLIDYIEDPSQPEFLGWVYGIGMVLLPFLAAFCLNHSVIFAQYVASQARVALNVAIYDKALRLSPTHDGASIGEIIDLINNDANRIVNSFHEIIFGLIAPFQIIIITGILYYNIGYFAFVSIGTIFVLIAPNAVVAKKMHLSRKRMLAHTDERLRSVAEFVQGIRSIKCYVWEEFFLNRIHKHRAQEVVEIRTFSYLKATLYFLMGILPSIVSLATFVGYVLAGNDFTPSKAFVTLSLLNLIRFPLFFIPVAILNISANIVSFGRIQKFLDQPEVIPTKVITEAETKISITDGRFNWISGNEPPSLKDVNLKVAAGEFVIVVGSVGSGKSTLLQAILGEVPVEYGGVEADPCMAYVPQQPWIINATLRENILMGSEFDSARFRKVTHVCALDPDLAMLAAGDMTQIGEKGVNLSGGQQQRLSLARAVYSDKNIVLLDDCLSAVDQKVSWHIFEKCINGYLRSKTVVMVTNNLSFLPYADKVVVLNMGNVVAQLTRSDMASADIEERLAGYGIKLQAVSTPAEGSNEEPVPEPEAIPLSRKLSMQSSPKLQKSQSLGESSNLAKSGNLSKSANLTKTASGRKFSQIRQEEDMRAILVQEEERMSGNIPWSVYSNYIHAGGIVLFIFVVLFFIIALGLHAAADYWLSIWTTDRLSWTTGRYLTVYAIFGGVELVFQSCGSFSIVGFGIQGANVLHDKMVASLSGATVQFFDANPLGRIINRFSRDQDMLDTGLSERMYQFFAALLYIVSTIVILGLTSYWIAIAVLPFVVIYFFVQKFYRKSSIELKRLEGVAKSPLLAQMVETLAGVQSIRAFGMQEKFSRIFHDKVDKMNGAYYALIMASQWLGLYLDLLGVGVLLATIIAILLQRDTINPGLVGLAIVYATSLRYALQFAVSSSTQTEIAMNGTERILEYTQLKQEPPAPPAPTPIPEGWPTQGRIEYDDVFIKYRPNLDPVLKGLNCTIVGGEKIGIVGRTGAGKSTLASSLFRLVDVNQGCISIDGIDINSIAIKDLRERITILPQMPMLFMGTIRENLDPFVKHSDLELWEALETVQLKEYVSAQNLKLEAPVDENGDNFSVGQKQLFCLARALLQGSKVLILDEAMANVDFKTEAIIGEAISSHLQSCTVLTVAHRLASILGSDRVMVMDKGRLVEFAPPQELMSGPTLFRSMVQTVGEAAM